MREYNIGFIGSGKMASAIIKGLIKSGFVNAEKLIATQAETEGVEEKSRDLGIKIILENKPLVEGSDIIFIATKPNQVEDVLKEISPLITPDKLVVSIAAGVTTGFIESKLPPSSRVIRVMPNTPALVLEGMSGVCKGTFATDEDVQFVMEMLSNIGKCIEVSEDQIDIVTAISGSGPAFFYKVIEDMARAGEKLGLDYEKSLELATQTAIGSAKMIENRGNTPVQTLIDNVATKGGCTFVGITVMNEENSDKLFYDVIEKTTIKAHELGK